MKRKPKTPVVTASVKNQREHWLTKATRKITRQWAKLGVAVPADLQLSCGFPGGGSPSRRIGECWPRARSERKVNQIFINPILDEAKSVLNVLGHELLHAADDCESGHARRFNIYSTLVGYSGGRNSHAQSVPAVKYLGHLVKILGDYPHGALELKHKVKKENTGLHKFECINGAQEDGAKPDVLYSTSANVERFGAPKCRCCGEEMAPAGRKDKKVVKTI